MRRIPGEFEEKWRTGAMRIAGVCALAAGLLLWVDTTWAAGDGAVPPEIGMGHSQHASPIVGAELSLSVDHGTLPVLPGDFVVVTLSMSEIVGMQAAGFQAFLEFDGASLAFVSGVYTVEPFSLPIITPIVANGDEVDLAAGIDVQNGQPPTSGPADLAILTFEALVPGCVSDVQFTVHEPPTRITDPVGTSIEPLIVTGLPVNVCPADIVPTCVVDVTDLLRLLQDWGLSGVPADINQDGIVNVNDLLILLASWGPCV